MWNFFLSWSRTVQRLSLSLTPPHTLSLSVMRVSKWHVRNILKANLVRAFWGKNPFTRSSGPEGHCARERARGNGRIYLRCWVETSGFSFSAKVPNVTLFPVEAEEEWCHPLPESIGRYCRPPHTHTHTHHHHHFKSLFLSFSNSLGIPLFSKSALQQVIKGLPCAVTQKQSLVWLPRLLVISFSISMLFSLLPPLSYYQGFLCQKQLIQKAGRSFLHLWDGKSDMTPRLRGQLAWEANRKCILAAVLWKRCS